LAIIFCLGGSALAYSLTKQKRFFYASIGAFVLFWLSGGRLLIILGIALLVFDLRGLITRPRGNNTPQ
jgi:hypothetical protein